MIEASETTAEVQTPPVEAPGVERVEERAGSARRRWLSTWIAVPIIALLVAVSVRVAVVEAYVIPSSSMEPTLQIDDRILVQKRLFDVNGIGVGDLVVFDAPAAVASADTKELIKRVVATGGDVVEARNGEVHVNGQALVEPYAAGQTSDFGPVQLLADELYVLGDNRLNSADSRVFGPIPQSSVTGSAFFGVWPVTRIHALD